MPSRVSTVVLGVGESPTEGGGVEPVGRRLADVLARHWLHM